MTDQMTRIEKDIFVRAKMSVRKDECMYSQFDTRSLERVIFKGEGYLRFSDSKVAEGHQYLYYRTSIALAEEIFAAHRADEIHYKATGTLKGTF